MMPRDGAGRMDLIGGTGAILRSIGLPGFMETFKADCTFQIQTPDNVDPGRTKRDVPWTWRISDDVGCANTIVGRVFIQCAEALHMKTLRRGDVEMIKVALHTCKEDLRNCEKALVRLAGAHDRIFAEITAAGGLKVVKGVVNNLPLIPNLEHDATIFLTSAKRALQSIAEVLNQFYGITISNARFDKGRTQLRALQPPPNPRLLEMLDHFDADIGRVLALRNFQEHTPKKTLIENFGLLVDSIHPPRWRIDPEPPAEMLPEMRQIIGGLVNLAECSFFIGLLDNIDTPPGPFVYVIEDVPEEHRGGAEIYLRCELKFTGGPGPAEPAPPTS